MRCSKNLIDIQLARWLFRSGYALLSLFSIFKTIKTPSQPVSHCHSSSSMLYILYLFIEPSGYFF